MSTFFITGTSGAGKTKLISYLKDALPHNSFLVYDFDEQGVPTKADKQWRLKTTESWLQKAAENNLHKTSTIVCGVSVPSEVLQISNKPDFPIYFGLIKAADTIIEKRLQKRGWSPEAIKDNITWARCLEIEVKRQNNHIIVDGSYLMPQDIAYQFSAWVRLFS